jgi:ABC-2 type transport system ATP-binding protein
MSIEVSSVSKLYGTQKALSTISFSVKKGSVVGFLGPNGAGKSTMMKILTGFINPTKGSVLVNGIDVLKNPIEAQKNIGYLPEHNPLYLDMYVKEYLQFQAAIYKVDKSSVPTIIEKVGLTLEAHKKVGQLSKGYQQRVGLAAALLHNPEVLILDEPTTGLDPNQLVEIRALIKELGKDKTVLFSTHIMQEVAAVCDRVIIIKKGEIVVDTLLNDIRTKQSQVIEVTFDYKIEEQFIKRLPDLKSYKNNYDNTWFLTFDSEKDMRAVVFDFAQENGLKILGLNTQNQNLENLFRESTS